MTDGYITASLKGLATVIAAANIAAYNPSGIYPDGVTGIVIGAGRLTASPADQIGINFYAGLIRYEKPSPTATWELVTLPVQLLIRKRENPGQSGTPLSALDLYERLYTILGDRTHLQLGPNLMDRVKETSSTALGADEEGRALYSMNLALTGRKSV